MYEQFFPLIAKHMNEHYGEHGDTNVYDSYHKKSIASDENAYDQHELWKLPGCSFRSLG